MYSLQKINPKQWETVPELSTFYADLPKHPYCTDQKGTCHPRHKPTAAKHNYIQPNHPASIKWLVFDIDNENALFAYHDNCLPRPQIIIKNPENGHAHYCYKLATEVGMWGDSSEKAIEYLKAVYNTLGKALGADSGYSGNLIKNPLSKQHETYVTGAQPSYTLHELAESLKLPPRQAKKPQADNDDHFGRNCAAFHYSRKQAYKIADKHDYSGLLIAVTAIVSDYNARFDVPMLPNEVHHIAKSITRFCKSPAWGKYSKAFIEKQQREGRKGAMVANARGANSKGGIARSDSYSEQREQAKKLREQGLSIRKIADQIRVSKNSIEKWIKVC